ncbi:MAG: nicotinate (nicotinamide) nucleotide adenylyltransferase [Spirochaetia bacterium]|nr:nicotinate (nicotinamide) nucleotide adenylyltransferase [Spirochaetia bacterium]
MKTIIIGGTFNPIHNGHLYISEELKLQFGYERILFIPSNYQAHKSSTELVPTHNRIDMLDLALKNSKSLVDLCEIERGGISYMQDTVKTIKEKYKISGKVGLFIGDDLIRGLSKWYNVDELLNNVDIVVAHRDSELELTTSVNHRYLSNVSIQISSSEIRNRIRAGKAFRYLIPESVYNYILKKELYR